MVIVYPFKLDAMGGLITTPIQHDTQLPNQAELMKEMLALGSDQTASPIASNSPLISIVLCAEEYWTEPNIDRRSLSYSPEFPLQHGVR
ncbi:hypothetical protein DAPPUDRAFT_246515 [Daphnia pulex]|uniref:Uncharacterized protein n=1 Tax=Daphnia pulex TaxID=6669 RepID=E9GQQ4_DAPPU|nr:hypothetical protein DAPPUDRAFT_270935 [Daphnia pulex]EFX78289.1 hypothetical protein DAPPUDRAFT_246515 [Daphnia pulex]|eukprot:EFX62139.1 hypothetical protein DAPPUDRAFT_270935 [Daphnia pulex]